MGINKERVDRFFGGREKEIVRRNFYYYRVLVLVFRIFIGWRNRDKWVFFFFLNVENI